MSVLVPCPECRRHIVEAEPRCPFCHHPVLGAAKLGGVRSLVFMGAVAGASALGCSDERPATKAPPPVEIKPKAAVIDAAAAPTSPADAAPVDAALADAGAPDAAAAKKRKKRVRAAKDVPVKKGPLPLPDPRPPPMPYGAPPARQRLV